MPSVSQLTIASGEGAANRGYFLHWGHTLYESAELQAAQKRFNDFLEEYSDVYAAQREISKVGVVVSMLSDQITAGNNYNRADGFSQALSDLHLPHDLVLADNSLTGDDLAPYNLLILPDVRLIGDTDLAALREFACGGGRVLVTGECGTYDENAKARKESLPDGFVLLEGSHELEYPARRLIGPDWGLVFRDAGHETLAQTILQLAGEPEITTDAPTSVKLNLAETPDALLVHMVNYECGMRLLRQRMYPHENVRITLKTETTVGKATLISPDLEGWKEALPYRQGDGCVELVVPRLTHYNMIKLDRESP